METSSIKQFNEKLKALPEFVVDELNDFMDYLKFKYSATSDGKDLYDWQKEILDERLNDLDKNPNETVEFNETVAELRKKYS